MASQFMRRGAAFKAVTLLISGLCLTTVANAGCLPPASELPQNQIQGFFGNPSALLTSNPTGGSGLENMVRALVASDNSALEPVIQLLSSANPQQAAAIGAGLAAAAQACLVPDQAFAGKIQTALAASGNRVALTAFVSAGGQESATAAIDAPGATAFVSGAGQVAGNSPILNTGNVVTPATNSSGGGNFLTFTGGAGPGGVSNPVSQ